jgi:2-dehydro-3-deoxyglucarate aldolase/4-hydroxy-2-oxoheptanedioate aldolase
MPKKSLRQRALAGETVGGAMVFEFFVPGMPQLLANAGCEYAIYDMEHGGLEYTTFKMLVAASRGTGVAPMVRVPRAEYHFIARALDVGAHGIMVPMVDTLEQARAIAAAARYPGKGRRGAAFGFAHDDYKAGQPIAKMREADARTFLMAQIETERGLEAVEQIASVEGIDCLWLGHFDLTNFLGIPGQFDNPKYIAAVDRIVAAAKKHGKARGYMAASADLARKHAAMGFNMIATGTDQGMVMAGTAAILAGIGG